MGLLINGQWVNQWYETKSHGGKFLREDSTIRNWITPDGAPGPSGKGGFKTETGRYHLYVSLACPWAHRTLIFRKLKNLEKHISISIVSPEMLQHGWTFCVSEGSTGDEVNHASYLYEIYIANDSKYTGRVTVPVLWDQETRVIVNNESSDIIRMFNQSFNSITQSAKDYYPQNLQSAIDKINEYVCKNVNNGVYSCGFATSQRAYESAYKCLFKTLDRIESILRKKRYLLGDTITEADWRLFTTLIRFDTVYYSHFKCNRQRIEDYPNISEYLRELYQRPGVSETVNFYHIKRHYYYSHSMINPTQIVPLGPEIDFLRPFNRCMTHK
ncbi:glutathione S-transferase family protein [Legionella israelensis]|uniref:S-transferase n=1 Tax=Legionella israelensis TaxID=454 RepID=A0A0W0V750_9GAMM|nr:glutathione S-transferase family protein [Legionella israelensis]KTD15955.1 S-transferase [Legionella israelensis]QBS10483.1 glutathione S-transferase family protein [Legionella israelensis]SCY52783.1 putative glutathione S-transferase [Legionella israelensis DSM 19235]STX60113.1 S-transferase [Legionella israelensis]